MARPSRRGEHAVNAEPNVIPFIDVMLVLLVIFMVAAPKPSTDLSVNLPRGTTVAAPEIFATTVTVNAAGDSVALFIEGEAVSQAQFRDRLFAVARARNPSLSGDLAALFGEAKILVAADQSVSYASVFGVVDDIDAAGFRKVNLIVAEAET
jgi:biopolymer transport protein ExbD